MKHIPQAALTAAVMLAAVAAAVLMADMPWSAEQDQELSAGHPADTQYLPVTALTPPGRSAL